MAFQNIVFKNYRNEKAMTLGLLSKFGIFTLSLVLHFNLVFGLEKTYQDSLLAQLNTANNQTKIKLLIDAAAHFQVTKADTAIILAKEGLSLAKLAKDSVNELEAIALLGRAYQNRSDFSKSAQYFYEALKIAEKRKNIDKLASFHNSIGISFFYLHDFDKAIEHIQRAAAYKLQLNLLADYGTTLGNLAGVLHQLGRNKEAISALKQAVLKLDGKKNKELLGNLYNTFGSIYQVGYNNLDSAEYFYRKALLMVANDEDGIFKLTAHTNIGAICSKQKKYDDAEYHLNEALKISKKLKRDIATISIYESFSLLYERKNDFKKAYDYKLLQTALKDSIFKQDKEKIVADLETQYESEKAKQLIQTQKLELAKSRNKLLIGVVISISLLFIALLMIVYFVFQSRLNKNIKAAKENFFSNVVHEIRSPLTMIQAPIKLIQSKTNDSEILAQLNIAEKSINKLSDLVSQMLLVSKIEANQFVIQNSYGNFNDFIEELIAPFKMEAKIKNQTLKSNLQIENPYFLFDGDALHKIISNLLNNALKYTQENGQIGLEIVSNSANLKIVVWDNGIGIKGEDKSKVFDRFYRTKDSIKSKGTGIGLSIVKGLVEAMQGNVDLQSENGEGCVFTIQIPIQTPLHELLSDKTGSQFILLVEDDNDISNFNKQLLEQNNYKVVAATNGLEAIQIVKNQLPDIIITDLMMPGMDGLELIRNLRGDANTEHIPVIVLSAKSSANSRIEVLKLGAQGYLTKPFIPEELLQLVNSQLLILKQKVEQFVEKVENKAIRLEDKYQGVDPYTNKFFGIIFENIDNSDFNVELLADKMATNRSHFQRKIKTLTGYSPSELIKMVRLDKSKELLLQKKGNITEVAYMCGFASQSYFTKSFSQHFGMSPSQFIAENKSN
jgi:signal transduction histidine kinase/CheY-like chemotaxis protein/AraC-like DNA-binding protein